MSSKALNINSLSPRDVIFFEAAAESERCQLKNFLYFLNSIGARRPIKFSYVEAQERGLEKIPSPKDYLMECVESVPWENKELVLKKVLEAHSNPAIMQLLALAGDLGQALAPMPPTERKLLGLVRGLLRPADYLFLERPEQFLGVAELSLFQNALVSHIRSTNQIVFIATPDQAPWAKLFNKRVERGPSMEFRLHEDTDASGQLNFSMPSRSGKKSA